MDLDDYFKGAKFYVWDQTFAFVRSKKPHPEAFAIIHDRDEQTLIIDERLIDFPYEDIQKGWRLITLDIVFPMHVVGVTARISVLLAEKNVSIMPLAAFSRDHFFVREKDLPKATACFSVMGLVEIKRKSI